MGSVFLDIINWVILPIIVIFIFIETWKLQSLFYKMKNESIKQPEQIKVIYKISTDKSKGLDYAMSVYGGIEGSVREFIAVRCRMMVLYLRRNNMLSKKYNQKNYVLLILQNRFII
jgi:hypothetical protein